LKLQSMMSKPIAYPRFTEKMILKISGKGSQMPK